MNENEKKSNLSGLAFLFGLGRAWHVDRLGLLIWMFFQKVYIVLGTVKCPPKVGPRI